MVRGQKGWPLGTHCLSLNPAPSENYFIFLCLSFLVQKVRLEITVAHKFMGGLNTLIHAICLEQCLTYYYKLLPDIYLDGHRGNTLRFWFFLHLFLIISEGHCLICNTFFYFILKTGGCTFYLLCTDNFKRIDFFPSCFIGISED